MANPTLKWTVRADRGTVDFGRLVPVTGNTYTVEIAGGAVGSTYTFYVMDESGEICLARSVVCGGETKIAFTSKALRERFDRNWHEVRAFHTVVSDGSNTVAEGDLSITWNPVWTDPDAGESYSMRGPQGVGITGVEFARTDANGNFYYIFNLSNGLSVEWCAPRGPVGLPGNANYVKDDATGKFHKLLVYRNRFGEVTVELDQQGIDNPGGDILSYVSVDGEQTITGAKTFTTHPLVPTPTTVVEEETVVDLTDETTKSANTSWVQKLVRKATAIYEAVHTWASVQLFNGGINVAGGAAIEGVLTVTGEESHGGEETHTGDETHAGNASFDNPVTVPTPTQDGHAANKEYVDQQKVEITVEDGFLVINT